MNNLLISDLNPVKFVEVNPVQLPQYVGKQLEDYQFSALIHDWEEKVFYCQKWQRSDVTYLQFTSNFDPIQIEVINAEFNISYANFNASMGRQNKWMPGYFIFEAAIVWNTFPEGLYFIKLTAGDVVMISEPISVKEVHENTLYLEYKNSRYHGDVLFETGIVFSFRVEGSIGFLIPSSEDQFYNDQRRNPTVLSSKTFRKFPVSIGGSYGVPDWVIDKINLIFSCNYVKIDGKEYAKTGDTKFTFNEEDNYPMRGMSFEVSPGINRGSKIISPTVDPNQRVVVVHNISGRVFGDMAGINSSVISITSIE